MIQVKKITSLIVVLFVGCNRNESPFQEVMDMPDYVKSELVKGEYQTAGNEKSKMLFGKQLVIEHGDGEMTKSYRIEGSKIYINMPNSDLETRNELELIISKNGDQLFCTACGQFGLDSVWVKK